MRKKTPVRHFQQAPICCSAEIPVRHVNRGARLLTQGRQQNPGGYQMEKTLFALSLGFVGLILATHAASGADHSQEDSPSQISFSDTPSNAQVMIRKNSFSGTILTSQTPAKTATAAAGINIAATFRLPGENWPSAQ